MGDKSTCPLSDVAKGGQSPITANVGAELDVRERKREKSLGNVALFCGEAQAWQTLSGQLALRIAIETSGSKSKDAGQNHCAVRQVELACAGSVVVCLPLSVYCVQFQSATHKVTYESARIAWKFKMAGKSYGVTSRKTKADFFALSPNSTLCSG